MIIIIWSSFCEALLGKICTTFFHPFAKYVRTSLFKQHHFKSCVFTHKSAKNNGNNVGLSIHIKNEKVFSWFFL